jgi:pyroglutamyl-peptidase
MVGSEILVTGFGPFLDVVHNPSGEVARRLDGREIHGLRVVGRVLPVSVARVPAALDALFDALFDDARPRLLVGLGVQREPNFRLERRARLPLTAAKPDGDGRVPLDDVGTMPAEEHTTDVDVEALVRELHARGVSARVSDDAGGYVCEWAYVHLLRHARRAGCPALFVHVPKAAAVALDDQEAVVVRIVEWLTRPL